MTNTEKKRLKKKLWHSWKGDAKLALDIKTYKSLNRRFENDDPELLLWLASEIEKRNNEQYEAMQMLKGVL